MAKRITAIVSLAIIGLLIVATLIMANITVNYRVNCKDPDSIWVYTSSVSGSNAGSGFYKEDEEYKKLLDLVNSASKEKFLTALFNGSANKKAEIKEVTTSTDKTITSPSSANYSYFVCFRYNDPQKLMAGSKEVKTDKGESYLYRELFFGIKEAEGVSTFDVYVNAFENVNVYKYHYYYELSANFTKLFEYLNDKKW